MAAEKTAEELRIKLSNVIKEFVEDNKLETSMSSLALDVSKISVLKVILTLNIYKLNIKIKFDRVIVIITTITRYIFPEEEGSNL